MELTGVTVEEEADASAVGGADEVAFAEKVGVALIERDDGEVEGGGRAEERDEEEEEEEREIAYYWKLTHYFFFQKKNCNYGFSLLSSPLLFLCKILYTAMAFGWLRLGLNRIEFCRRKGP